MSFQWLRNELQFCCTKCVIFISKRLYCNAIFFSCAIYFRDIGEYRIFVKINRRENVGLKTLVQNAHNAEKNILLLYAKHIYTRPSRYPCSVQIRIHYPLNTLNHEINSLFKDCLPEIK